MDPLVAPIPNVPRPSMRHAQWLRRIGVAIAIVVGSVAGVLGMQLIALGTIAGSLGRSPAPSVGAALRLEVPISSAIEGWLSGLVATATVLLVAALVTRAKWSRVALPLWSGAFGAMGVYTALILPQRASAYILGTLLFWLGVIALATWAVRAERERASPAGAAHAA